jgi:hypothetical protein
MNDNDYNEELKYPLFRIHPVDPRLKAEAATFLHYKSLETRISDAIKDHFNVSENFCWLDVNPEIKGAYASITIPRVELDFPFQQLEDDYLKATIKTLRKELKRLKITEPITSMGMSFEYLFHGVTIEILIYG